MIAISRVVVSKPVLLNDGDCAGLTLQSAITSMMPAPHSDRSKVGVPAGPKPMDAAFDCKGSRRPKWRAIRDLVGEALENDLVTAFAVG